jgi:hypothetical protein
VHQLELSQEEVTVPEKSEPIDIDKLVPGKWYKFVPHHECVIHIVVDRKIALESSPSLGIFLLSNEIFVDQLDFDRVWMVKCIVGEQVGFLIVGSAFLGVPKNGDATSGTFYDLDEDE